VIHFNFGIHDRGTPLADYTQRLERLIERMQKTGAKLLWASTTPIPDDLARNQAAGSIAERNRAAAELMARHGIAVDDLFTAVTPHLAEMQNLHHGQHGAMVGGHGPGDHLGLNQAEPRLRPVRDEIDP